MTKLKASEVRPHPRIADLWVTTTGVLFTSRRELQQSQMANGYMRVNIKRGGKQITLLVHRAVAETFMSNPEGKEYVNHLDGNKQNNCLTNLMWATPSENAQHAWDTGLVTAYKRTQEHREQFAAMVRKQPRGRRGHCIASQQVH